MSAPAVGTDGRPMPWLMLLTPPNPYSKTGGRTIVIYTRGYRSKYARLTCFCKRRRKDGTCQTIEGIRPWLKHPDRISVEHPEIDDRVTPIPAPMRAKQKSGAL